MPNTKQLDLTLARRDPGAVFASPSDIAAHPGLSLEEKVDLLERWAYDATELEVAEWEGMEDPTDGKPLLRCVLQTLHELTQEEN
jgi:hypothetical protein